MKGKFFQIVRGLEETRNVPQFLFATFIHHQAVVSVRKEVLAFKAKSPDIQEIDLIIHSPGGFPDAAYRIIRTFRKNFETVNIIIPFWAKSAATLLSMGGSKIVMDEFGEFGPLDAQIGKPKDDSPEYDRESALTDEHSISRIETRFKEMFESMFINLYEHTQININKNELFKCLLEQTSNFYAPLLRQINPYKLGEKRRILDIGEQYAIKILAQYGKVESPSKIRKLVTYLVNECPDHGYVIDFDLIKLFLDNVYSAEEFGGQNYRDNLTTLSMFLLSEFASADEQIIGFLPPSNTNEETGQENNIPLDTFGDVEQVDIFASNGKISQHKKGSSTAKRR